MVTVISQRVQRIAAILCLGLTSGCAYDRGVGWHWDPDGIRDGVINSVSSMVSGSQTTAQSMEDDSDEFFNR